uniref:(California timema) hypothetical protein n=1 Tax=Timema californicum TaxID=61474 RepID=A0A7R9PCC8_TIMCA|nr:unnamed protein product [Timema californicum]
MPIEKPAPVVTPSKGVRLAIYWFRISSKCTSVVVFFYGESSPWFIPYPLQANADGPGRYPGITVSGGVQVCVGIVFLVIGGLNINRQVDQRTAVILNDTSLVMVFIISLVNVIISSFGMEHSSQPLRLLREREEKQAIIHSNVKFTSLRYLLQMVRPFYSLYIGFESLDTLFATVDVSAATQRMRTEYSRLRKCIRTCMEKKVGNHLGRTALSTRDQDLNPDLPIIGRSVYCESGALEQLDKEAGEEFKRACLAGSPDMLAPHFPHASRLFPQLRGKIDGLGNSYNKQERSSMLTELRITSHVSQENESGRDRCAGDEQSVVKQAGHILMTILMYARDVTKGEHVSPVAYTLHGRATAVIKSNEASLLRPLTVRTTTVSAAILGVLLMTMNLNHPDKQYTSAVLNHCTLSCVMGSMVSDVIKMSFGLDAAVPLTASYTHHFQNLNVTKIFSSSLFLFVYLPARSPQILQGIINVTLGSAFNINKTAHQTTANVWNNVVLSLNIITTATNVVISAFDMRQTSQGGGMSILTTASTPTTSPAPSLLA